MDSLGFETDSLDFEVEVGDRAGQEYSVTARAPGGEATVNMCVPETPEELDRRLSLINDAVLASSAVARRAVTGDEQPVQQFGRHLFDTLLIDDVRALYVASAQRAREEGRAMRLVLRIRPPELARLPWEFLFDPGRQDYLGLSLPLVRYPQVLAPRQPVQVAPPLRILGMVARPGDKDALETDREQQRLRAALAGLERDGFVELSWVAGQTYTHLEDAMDRGPWHVFHFVGHGGYDSNTEEGTIALATEHGRTDPVGADDLSRLLGEHHTLRLVVLNACDTGRAGVLDAFSSTAGALVRRGIPAVVAMQFTISDPAAIRFAQTFYHNVAKRLPLDVSVMRARRDLRRAKRDTLEWGTPVLYLRARDARVFGPASTPSTPLSEPDPRPEPVPEDVEALYDDALAAFWTERYDRAADLLRQVLARRPDHPDAPVKLEQARRQWQLATRYADGCAAADADDWERAIAAFTLVAEAELGYKDVGERLRSARKQQQIVELLAEAQRLHNAGQWAAVIKVAERLRTLDLSAADQADLTRLEASAQAELAKAEQSKKRAADYRSALRLLDNAEWQQAIETLERVAAVDPAYRDTQELLAMARRQLHTEPKESPQLPLPTPGPKGGHLDRPSLVHTFSFDSGTVKAMALSADGRWLIVGGSYATVIWEVTNRKQHLIKYDSCAAVAFSPDSRLFAAVDTGGIVRIRGTTDGKLNLTGKGVRAGSGAIAFSPDGRRLATVKGNTARIWDAASGQELMKLTIGEWSVMAPTQYVNGVAFSPDGDKLATAASDNTVRIWDSATGRALNTLTHRALSARMAFSPDSRWLATSGRDHTARIWDAAIGRLLVTVSHKRVTDIAFSPDGDWIATAGGDKAARVWDATTGRELITIPHSKAVLALAFGPDGHQLATASKDMVQIWALPEGTQ